MKNHDVDESGGPCVLGSHENYIAWQNELQFKSEQRQTFHLNWSLKHF